MWLKTDTFQVDPMETKYKRDMTSLKLRESLAIESPVEKVKYFTIELPKKEDHAHHEVGKVSIILYCIIFFQIIHLCKAILLQKLISCSVWRINFCAKFMFCTKGIIMVPPLFTAVSKEKVSGYINLQTFVRNFVKLNYRFLAQGEFSRKLP